MGRDGSGNAFVIFAGTNDGSKDIWADAKLTNIPDLD